MKRRCASILPPLPALALVACATTGEPALEEELATPREWTVGVAEHVSLWYHGGAYAAAAVDATEPVLPIFRDGYVEEIVREKRRRGVYPTVLDRRAAEFGELFEDDDAYTGLAFLPLYFRDGEALFSAIELWRRLGGNPRAAGTAEGARVVAFLSDLFPGREQRRVVAEWAAVLQEEREAFFTAYWAEEAPRLQPAVTAVQAEWDALAPSLATYLDYLGLTGGDLLLVPALGPEGRTVTTGPSIPRAAVMTPIDERPRTTVWSFVHELVYPLARDAVRDYVAPARIREIGETVLLIRAAVRGGAMLLDREAPRDAAEYRRFYLAQVPANGERDGDLEARFEAAFPLPPGLEAGLAETVETAVAGI